MKKAPAMAGAFGVLVLLFLRSVIDQFKPHGVQNGEGDGQRKAQNPSKIPHVICPF
ncbi:hypothetical protein BVG79_00204 [Ketogulonicigenium robustum]|uniref:Uncharacterized protein n=1 Tax=Ketogulonicigenium robustum TaxID=92947 RepID=A0A1W6NWI6_9RHOB|nr:hypothetical protein BVG79_00204 [Ketogulonicigenium robustum]